MGMESSLTMAVFLLILSCFCWGPYSSLAARDSLTPGQKLSDEDQDYLLSEHGIFTLGFFSTTAYSKDRYLGLWYTSDSVQEVVWVANRNTPIVDSSGALTIDGDGNLIIIYSGRDPIVLNSVKAAGNTIATLHDSGNLILTEENSTRVLWESFDYPTNTLLPGMKLGVNFKTGHNWSLTSWIKDYHYYNYNYDHDYDDSVPAPGAFTLGGDPKGSSQLFIWRRGEVYWASGVWQNGSFEFDPSYAYNDNYNFSFVETEEEKYFTYSVKNTSTISRLVMNWWGQIDHYISTNDKYFLYWDGSSTTGFRVHCDDALRTTGCVGKLPECRRHVGEFISANRIVPNSFDGQNNTYPSLTLGDCHAMCWKNCSCGGFASINENGTGCQFWSEELISQSFDVDYNYNLLRKIYISEEAYVQPSTMDNVDSTKKWWMIGSIMAVAPALVVLFFSWCYKWRNSIFSWYYKWRNSIFSWYYKWRNFIFSKLEEQKENAQKKLLLELRTSIMPSNDADKLKNGKKMGNELQLFSFDSIMAATDNFSSDTKLGQGGFGPVYKGKLHEGQEVAVKRLSRSSGQGLIEFKNEIVLIAELQHTNLVKLMGCCIEGEEKMLIYEYMPNKSLDSFLFDPIRKALLDWRKRFNIIEGIAQGLLYLHKFSTLRVIHRDLKASNILLDDELNPKISDFGLARIFGRNESEANTNRVVGTYGYMSPEYAMEGIFSVKSDVFSFGVLLLEIVSSRRNTSFYHSDHPLNLIGYTWELWNESRALELMDQTLGDSCPTHELLRCIHVGLLCVQESAMDRPTMSDVVYMFTNDTMPLPAPKKPAFLLGRNVLDPDLPESKPENCSINVVTISVMEAR